jgi:hypothetical protein
LREPSSASQQSGKAPLSIASSLVGQRKLSLTADTYTHVLSDGRELDYPALVTELIS